MWKFGKNKKTILYSIDRIEVEYSYVSVYGWACDRIYKKAASVHAYTQEDAALSVQAQSCERADVNEQFQLPQNTTCGFVLTIPLVEIRGNHVRLEFQADDHKKSVLLSEAQLQEHSYHQWFQMQNPDKQQLHMQSEQQFPYMPKISIVIPAYNTKENYLIELLDSIQAQSYKNWELCIADGSDKPVVQEVVARYMRNDECIRYMHLEDNRGISDNTNEAIRMATGDWLMFADHDDLLCEDALYEIVKIINTDDKIDAVYTDEDKINADTSLLFEPAFKPDFNLEMLRENNYICHIFTVKRELIEQVGMLRSEYDGAQDYDFVLRCCEKAGQVAHVAKPLYHWRAHPDSTAGDFGSKMYAFEAGRRAVEAHYKRVGIEAHVTMAKDPGHYRSHLTMQDTPMVSIIIPNMDHEEDLRKCIDSIFTKTTYENYEILIVENNSTQQSVLEYYQKLQQEHENIHVLKWQGTFNYAGIHNYACKHAKGEYLLLLNNDIEIVHKGWIQELLAYCQRTDVGAVGAKLLYPDQSIQHSGVIIGLGGVAGHIFHTFPSEKQSYAGRADIPQELSAVTAALMMTKKSAYEQVGGMDEKLEVSYNDIDYCLQLRAAGYKIIYHPYVTAYHYESKTRGYDTTVEKKMRIEAEAEVFREKWSTVLVAGDPYYNRNLSRTAGDCSLNWEFVGR